MKSLFSVKINPGTIDVLLLILRVSVAVMMLTHGWPKLNRLIAGGEIKFLDFMGLGPGASLALAVFAEVVCSIFILFGFGTRIAAIPLIITTLVIVFHAHADDPFSKKEMPVHYMVSYFILLVAGSGKYSVDKLISNRYSPGRSLKY